MIWQNIMTILPHHITIISRFVYSFSTSKQKTGQKLKVNNLTDQISMPHDASVFPQARRLSQAR